MRNIYFGLSILLLSQLSFAQEFEVELLSDTILTGLADPELPIIFYFDANNLGEETFLVDMIREETDIPDGWEISLCTEACFPPEVTEAVFFLDEMATDEVSVYFYASSEGLGMTSVRFTNTEDSTNTFQYELYVDAEPLSLLETDPDELKITYNSQTNSIDINTVVDNRSIVTIYDINGSVKFRSQLQNVKTVIRTNMWSPGIYLVQIPGIAASKVLVR